MARNLVKYGVTEPSSIFSYFPLSSSFSFSPRFFRPRVEKAFLKRREVQTTEETRRTKISPQDSFLSGVIGRPFTTLSQVVVTFNEDEVAHETSKLLVTRLVLHKRTVG